MNRPYHIGIVSVLFDRKPEGICTGRLVRALLAAGHRVTLWTSSKSDLSFQHERLRVFVKPSGIRSPRWLFNAAARLSGTIPNNFYLWTRRISRELPENDIPDVICGRAWPHASLVAADEVARRLRRPFILHLSDPFPQPPDKYRDSAFLDTLQLLADRCAALTFTNQETIAYQRRFIDFPEEKAVVLNHVGPPAKRFGKTFEPSHFIHIGTVRADRPAEPLLDGFSLYNRQHPESRLTFVGDVRNYLQPLIQERGLSEVVHIQPYTRDVNAVMQRASLLVSLDAQVDDPVFTPTKIIEYLRCDRPILAVTPTGSPVEALMKRSPETTVTVSDYSSESIAKGFAAAAELGYRPESYEERFSKMEDFTPEGVAVSFYKLVEEILTR